MTGGTDNYLYTKWRSETVGNAIRLTLADKFPLCLSRIAQQLEHIFPTICSDINIFFRGFYI